MRHRSNGRPQPTFEELLSRVRDLPAGHRGQILDGVAIVADPPTTAQAHTIAEISAMVMAGSSLGDPVPDGWSFLSNVEIALERGAEVRGLLVADVAGWHCGKEALAAAGSPVRVPPTWVCEVLGGATRTFTLTAKRQAYVELGVQHLWIADPEAEVLEIFQNHRGKWLLVDAISDAQQAHGLPFDALRFDASDLWVPPSGPRSHRDGPSSKRQNLPSR